MRPLSILALVLVIVGALNWGLVGIFDFNLITWIFGLSTAGITVTRVIYILVGFAGLYGVLMLTRLWTNRDDICVPGHLPQAAQQG
jgi:uncharacterized membrane protein YuzA (DUF378 family)